MVTVANITFSIFLSLKKKSTNSIKKKEKFFITPPAINSLPKNPELCRGSWLIKPIELNPKKCWKITSKDITKTKKVAVIKKYLKFKRPSSLKRYTITNIKKYLKNSIDFINLSKLIYSKPSKYKDFVKLKLVEKKITKNNKKIILIEKLNLVVKIFDRKRKIPKTQNNIRLMLIAKFPIIKLIGKKAKVRFINKIVSIEIFFLFKFTTLFNI